MCIYYVKCLFRKKKILLLNAFDDHTIAAEKLSGP